VEYWLKIQIYKGYVYDQETGLNYCQTRFYNPNVGRWLSVDDVSYLDPASIGGLNLYAYCGNNPVMYTDPSGYFVITSFLIGVGIAALIGLGVGAISYTASEVISYGLTGEWSWSWGLFSG
jgi:RHS repeat-associated protein